MVEINMEICDLPFQEETLTRQAAEILVAGFQFHWPGAWPDLESGIAEVQAAQGSDRICRAALGPGREVLGWIGGLPTYDGNVWELHPLVVAPVHQGKGIGRALVLDFEDCVRARGGLTILLGTDDMDEMTSLAGVDLYKDVGRTLQAVRNLKRHPFEFYQRLGYVIVGVVPDANGRGCPDILMAKRV